MQWNRTSSFEFDGKSMGTEITTQSEFPNAGKAIVQQIQPGVPNLLVQKRFMELSTQQQLAMFLLILKMEEIAVY